MLADAKHITEKLSELSGVRKMDQGLIQAVEAREVVTSTPEKLENGTKKTNDEVLFDAAEDEKEEKEETLK
jgi:hypothetical protein